MPSLRLTTREARSILKVKDVVVRISSASKISKVTFSKGSNTRALINSKRGGYEDGKSYSSFRKAT